jgi:hypothetical protein
MFISQSVKLISDNIWIGLVLWHTAYINDYEKYTTEAFYLLIYLSEINFD